MKQHNLISGIGTILYTVIGTTTGLALIVLLYICFTNIKYLIKTLY